MQRPHLTGVAVAILIPASVFLPFLGYTVAKSSSLAAGVLASSLLAIVFSPHTVLANWRHLVILSVAPLLVLGIHALVAEHVMGAINWPRFAVGLIGATSMLIASLVLSKRIGAAPDKLVYLVVLFCIAIISINALMPIIGIDLGLKTSTRPAGFYSEPSHLAVSLSPLLLFALFRTKRTIYLPIVAMFFIWALVYQSLIAIALTCLVCVAATRRVWHLALASVVAVTASTVFLGLDYVLPRISIFSVEHGNASTWVLVRGWEDAVFSVRQSFWLGIGFQQYGSVSAGGAAHRALAAEGREWINVLDGGSTAPKLIGEFGLFGVLIVVLCLIAAAAALKTLRKRPEIPEGRALLLCFVASLPVDLFIRGMGYFTPTILLGLAGIFLMLQSKRPLHSR